MSRHTSSRRFDIGSQTQPILQFIAATLPFFALLFWFLFEAHMRPNAACYYGESYYTDDDQTLEELRDACSDLIPLQQFLWVFLAALFCWTLLAMYLTFYVPRRHSLVKAYLTQGQTVIGDVHYNRKKRSFVALTATGHVVYPHPDDATGRIRKKVYVFERYTRERAALVYLPGQPLSAQPRVDLEIDRDVTELNEERMAILTQYSWAWVIFCLLAPLYILKVMDDLSNGEELAEEKGVWQPDTDLGNFSTLYYVLAFAVIPVTSVLCISLGWFLHKRWMTKQHKVLEDGEPPVEPSSGGCCFDDEECESIEVTDYVPPSPTADKGALA